MNRVFRLGASLVMAGVCSMVQAGTPAKESAKAPAAKHDFVTVKDTHFARKGKLYYIAGANFWYGGYLGAASGVGERARLVKELDSMKAIGINNVRVLAVSEKTDMKSGVKPATTSAPGKYDENLLAGMDFLIAELAKRDMTVVIYLGNYWQWSGGFSQYLEWFEGTKAVDPNVSKDYNSYIANTAKFYKSKGSQNEFRNVVKAIVSRVNTVTGKPYRDDPTIMSWQLANEPRPGLRGLPEADKQIYIKWLDEMGAFIHSLDQNHLVSTGSEGLAGSAQDEKLFMDAHKSRHIDYLTYHLWPKNWEWFNSAKPVETWDGAIAKSRDYLNKHIDWAKTLGKPIVLEEFGLDRDGASFSVKSTTKIRDRFYREVFDLVARRAEKGEPIAGWNFWAWGGAGRAANADYWWKEGNDFVGDPPQEEQGLYSVFDSDVTSIVLIKEYADRLKKLQK